MIAGRRIVALCVSCIQNEDIQNILYPIYCRYRDNGWKVLIFNTCTDLFEKSHFDTGEKSVFSLINFDIVDAAVIFSLCFKDECVIDSIASDAAKYGKPVFVVDGEKERHGCINVRFDEENAFRNLVTHLVEEHNLTKLNCIAGIEGNPISEHRLSVFKEVLAEHGIPFDDSRLGYGNFYSTPTKAVMRKFLNDSDNLPEAIVCINDSMAITACEVLNDNGFMVPNDIIVTGFDGIEHEKYCSPRLTTCRRDYDAFAELLCNLSEGSACGMTLESEYTFPYTLDISESCGCCPRNYFSSIRSITGLYERFSSNTVFARSMNNMLTKLSNEQDVDTIRNVLKYYIRFNAYICMNSDFDDDYHTHHTYGHSPFTDTVSTNGFFYGSSEISTGSICVKEMLPDWEYVLSNDEPVIFSAIHSQERVYGYMASFVVGHEFEYFTRLLMNIHSFVLNLDNCVGMYVQQNVLTESNERLRDVQNKIIASFADMVESRDQFTGQHIKRTGDYLKILVEHLSSKNAYADILSEDIRELMYKAAPLHDIGKIKISDTILNKPGRLTDEEFDIIKTHTTEGGNIIRMTLTDIEDSAYVDMAYKMAFYHHEKWDGSGYPCGLKGNEIPLCARIMAVVDVFDALTSKRVYKDAFPVNRALDIVRESGGTHFDPDITAAFLEISAELAEILRENPDSEV